MRLHRHDDRGFSLIETAIVLGVAAIILAAVWAAGSTAYENSRRGQLAERLAAVVNNIRVAYGGQTGIAGNLKALLYPDALNAPKSATLTGHLAIVGTIPGDMIRDRSPFQNGGNMIVDGPWGPTGGAASGPIATGSFNVCAWVMPEGVAPNCTTNGTKTLVAQSQYFAVELAGLRTDSCIVVATANSSANGPAGLQDVVINGTSIVTGAGVTNSLPVLVKDANALCPPTAPATSTTVDFVYLLRTPMP
jgi:prepilin-type N-terminal cleavage/methylation domain-containing protein